jgi:hypothetical protein
MTRDAYLGHDNDERVGERGEGEGMMGSGTRPLNAAFIPETTNSTGFSTMILISCIVHVYNGTIEGIIQPTPPRQ